MRILAILGYIAAIVVANVLTASYHPWFVAGVAITAGTWLIGPSFVLRDAVQLAYGRRIAYAALAAGLVANYALSVHNADLAWITTGSCAAYAVSETLDAEAFTRLRARLARRVLFAGLVSGSADSIVFVTIGLSPLTTGFVAWGDAWRVVVAQMIVKSVCVAACATPFTSRFTKTS